MTYVITCGDEGIQLNEGTRLGVVGSGVKFEHADKIIGYLKQLFPDVFIVSSEENDWVRTQFQLNNWEQTNATFQQQVEVIADRNKVDYAGFLAFTDPKMIKEGVKGHLVRPKNIHIANSISFTLGGGEQKYHLGKFVISADWVHLAKPDFVKKALIEQIEYYKKLAKVDEIKILCEEEGSLDPEIIAKNKAMLEKTGLI